jgi:hypothetical protein
VPPYAGAHAPALASLELGTLALCLSGVQFLLQCGRTEAGVAALQALLEYNLFSPEGEGSSSLSSSSSSSSEARGCP